jgi:hypothetical protein
MRRDDKTLLKMIRFAQGAQGSQESCSRYSGYSGCSGELTEPRVTSVRVSGQAH